MEDRIVQLIQTQMNNERYNSQVYFALANMTENLAYDGIASWFRKQAQGEIEHAQKFAEFLISKRIAPVHSPIAAISNSLSLPEITKRAADLERTTTSNLQELYDLSDSDPQVCSLLDWFLMEQIEEETVTQDLADLVARTNTDGWNVLDERYGKL